MYALLLSDKSYTITLNVVQCLSQRGLKSIIIGSEGLDILAASRSCQKIFSLPSKVFLQNEHLLLDTIKQTRREYEFTAIFPTGTDSTYFLCRHKADLSGMIAVPPLPSPDTFQTLNDKWQFSMFLERNNIPQPQTMLINGPSDLKHSEVTLHFPVLTKPLDQEFGIGINHFQDHNSFVHYVNKAIDNQEDADTFPCIAQEFIPGEDIDLSILCLNGDIKAWTIQQRDHRGRIHFVNRPEVLEIGRHIVSTIRYDGIAHFDMRIDERDNSIKVIECNPRFWGTTYSSCFAGVNFPALYLDALNGHTQTTKEPSSPIIAVPLQEVVKNLLRGPSGWKTVNSHVFRSAIHATVDQLPYRLYRLQKNHPALASFIGNRLEKKKVNRFPYSRSKSTSSARCTNPLHRQKS